MEDQLKQSVLGFHRSISQTSGGAEAHDCKEQNEVFDMDLLVDANTDIASNHECNNGKAK